MEMKMEMECEAKVKLPKGALETGAETKVAMEWKYTETKEWRGRGLAGIPYPYNLPQHFTHPATHKLSAQWPRAKAKGNAKGKAKAKNSGQSLF